MRIARVERSVAYNPTDQPTASGDWGAPGKALQGFGKSISDFSGALIESQNQEDDFKTKLALTNFHGQQQQDYENYRANYTGKPEDFQSGWNARYGQAWSEFAPTLPQNPRSQRNAALYGAQLYNNFNSHAQNTQLGMVHAAGVAQVESTINGSLAQLDAANPDQVPGAIDQAIRGVNAMIDAAPPGIMTPADKARLRSQTATLALSRLEKYFTDRGIDPVPAMQETMKRWAADPALQGQRPAMPGPTSAPGGAPGGKPMDIAKQYLGMDENQNTTALASFFRKSGGQSLNPSETAWCAAFVNAALGASGSKGTGSLLARDFLKVGTETKSPSVGDIVVLSRGDRNGWQGHVGFYAGKDGNGNVLVLGGNQGNKVSVASYPAARVLGYRVPPEAGSKVSGLDLPPVGPEPSTGGISATATAYSPKAGGDAMEGGYASARPGPDGKSEVRTLADVASGRSQYVTLAGDKSQDGKTYIIPEITFRDAAGKEQTLKNVKGVVHDTGSAFRGRGDQAFDIPADRDLPDGGASQPYSKQKITFIPEGKAAPDASKGVKVASADGSVPETAISAQRYTPPQNDSGIPRDPEREHYRLDGDASTKARQLREIIASGRQDVVHQLDSQGADVVAVKKSDKPVWHVNAVTKDANGAVANALDKGDQFTGPGWAKDTIADWRAGKIKPASPDMESANAASLTPPGSDAPSHGVDTEGLKYMRPSVQSEMMQAVTQHWPKFEAMQARFVKGFEDKVKATIEVANAGYDPRPEDMDQIRAVVARNPELMRKYGLDQIVAGLEGAITKSQLTRKMTPMALDVAIKRLDDHMVMGGATKEMLAQKKQLETLRDSMRKAVDADALTWAEKARIVVPLAVAPPAGLDPGQKARWSVPTDEVHLTPINFAAPNAVDQLRQRADVARGVGLYYGQAPQYFTKIERDHLKDVFRTGGAPMLATLGTIYSALGPDTPAAMREFVKDAPEAAMMGKLMADGGDRKLLEDAAKGLHLRVVEGDKFISRVDRKMAEPDVASLTPAMARTPGMIDPVIRMTNAVYEYQHRYLGKETFDLPLYRTIMAEVMGQTKGPDGVLYGGVGRQSTGWVSSANVVVPPSVRQDSFNALVGSIRDSDLPVIGSPAHEDGRPLTASEVRSAQWQSVGNGRYGLLLGTSPNEEPMYAWDHTRQQPFVLDLNPIMGTLRKRVPEIFRK